MLASQVLLNEKKDGNVVVAAMQAVCCVAIFNLMVDWSGVMAYFCGQFDTVSEEWCLSVAVVFWRELPIC
jgi:hypothetical protein